MKKRLTFLMMAALLATLGVQAKMVKTIEFKLTDAEFVVSYTGTNSVNTETGELSLGANSTCAWDRYFATPKFNLSTSDFFVIKLKEAATQDLFVLINQKGFWETVGDNASDAKTGIGYMGSLKAGDTELKIALAGLKSNMSVHANTAIDLSDIWMINLWTGGGGGACTYKIDEIYAEAYAASYDEVIETPVWNKTSFSWEGDNNAKAEWGGENMTIDKANKKITKTNGAWEGNNAVAWLNYVSTDISGYDRLVLELDEASNGPVEVVVSDAGFWGGKCHSAILATGETELVLTLSELKITGTPGGEDTWAKGDPLDLENVNLIFIRTDIGTANQIIDVKDFYLATAAPSVYSLIRENTTASTYGTICLPFAAAKPSNANVYEVVGWNASNVYFEEVTELEAGKGYVFQSTDAEDITFTKTGTAENLIAPISGNALTGYFNAAERYVPVESYILVGTQWKRVPSANRNQVGLYRAYLTLSEDLKVSTAPARAITMNLVGGSETTGIENVNGLRKLNTAVYDLSGRRIMEEQLQRGVYVKEGKKVFVTK